MTQTQNLSMQPLHPVALWKLMLAGVAIWFIAILYFVIPGILRPDPSWSSLWMIRPLIVTPLVGAAAGAGVYLMDFLCYQGGWKKTAGNVLSVLGCLLALWMGIILGLVGTMWH